MPTTPGRGSQYVLLATTVLGTVSNQILTVPLSRIAAEFDAPPSAAVSAVSAFSLTLAVLMPLSGWLCDRFGHRRVLVVAVVVMSLGHLGAALSPSLGALILVRAVQGAGCSVIPPAVMGLLNRSFPHRRSVLGAWAAANGAGQALGPPLGGILADLIGWRGSFLLMCGLSLVCAITIRRLVPAFGTSPKRFDWWGTALVMGTLGSLLTSAVIIGHTGEPALLPLLLAGAALVLAATFVVSSRHREHVLIAPRLLVEPTFAWHTAAVNAQMFTLGSLLVAVPLHLTQQAGLTPSLAGLVALGLPLAMTILAPWVGRLLDRGRGHLIPLGLALTAVAAGLLGAYWTWLPGAPGTGPASLILLGLLLALAGAGMALVQAPAAAGASRSPAGQLGAGLGLFNASRFAGSTLGAAAVALAYPSHLVPVMAVCAALLVGLAVLSWPRLP